MSNEELKNSNGMEKLSHSAKGGGLFFQGSEIYGGWGALMIGGISAWL